MSGYLDFLAAKSPADPPSGIVLDPCSLPACLKPFQRAVTAWALRRGRAAMFEGTGLGKTLQQLSWARAVANEEQDRILILTPLAVAEQTVAEAAKFGIDGVSYAPDPDHANTDIVVTNYERFDKFDISAFAGIVLDESGIIKSADGKTRGLLTEACRDVPWRLCCTATPAPNDYTELGQHAEFLGVMTAKEMLSMFFVHEGSIRADGGAAASADGWRLKRHAEADFWRWLASWAVVIRSPADLGFDEPGYDLPPLRHHQVTVATEASPMAGMLFPVEARTLSERIAARRQSVVPRVAAIVDLITSDSEFIGKLSACGNQNTMLASWRDTIKTLSIEPNSLKPINHQSGEPIRPPITKQTKTNGSASRRKSANEETRPDEKNTPLSPSTQKNDRPLNPQKNTNEGERIVACGRNTGLGSLSTPSFLSSSQAAARSAAAALEKSEKSGSASIIATIPDSCEGSSALSATLALENSQTILTGSTAPSNTYWKGVEQWIIWCGLNDEQKAIENALGSDLCFSVYGSLEAEEKTRRIWAWLRGERPILLSKPSICGYGLNLQQCRRMIFCGVNDSFEQLFQSIRRCWRFGQTEPVDVYLVASELEGAVVANLRRKEADFEAMLDAMSGHMRDLMRETVRGGRVSVSSYHPTIKMETPTWLTAA